MATSLQKNRVLFEEFVNFLVAITDNDREVVNLIKKRFNRANVTFVQSEEFKELLGITIAKIQGDSKNKYVHVREFVTELKAYSGKPVKGSKRKNCEDAGHAPDAKKARTESESDARSHETASSRESSVSKEILGSDQVNNHIGISHKGASSRESSVCSDAGAELSLDPVPNTNKSIADSRSEPTNVVRRLNTTLLSEDDSAQDTTGSCYNPFALKKNHATTKAVESDEKEDEIVTSCDLDCQGAVTSSPHNGDIVTKNLPSPSKRQLSPSSSCAGERTASPCETKADDRTDDSASKQCTEGVAEPGTSQKDRRRGSSRKAEEAGKAGDSGSDGGKTKASDRQIRKLEKLLKEISKEIQRLEEEELSLDDLAEENSSYTLIDRYKKKFVKVWDKLCEVKGRATTTGRVTERKFKYEGSRYPDVNRKIEKFINKHQVFPDFHDIRDIILTCNRRCGLRLGKKIMDHLARDTFTDVGNKLQERRQEDFVGNFGSHLTETFRAYQDPALYDKDLKSKLETNKQTSKIRMDEVLSKFAVRQDRDGDKSDTEEEEEDEEEEEVHADEELKRINNDDETTEHSEAGASHDEEAETEEGEYAAAASAHMDDQGEHTDTSQEADVVESSSQEESLIMVEEEEELPWGCSEEDAETDRGLVYMDYADAGDQTLGEDSVTSTTVSPIVESEAPTKEGEGHGAINDTDIGSDTGSTKVSASNQINGEAEGIVAQNDNEGEAGQSESPKLPTGHLNAEGGEDPDSSCGFIGEVIHTSGEEGGAAGNFNLSNDVEEITVGAERWVEDDAGEGHIGGETANQWSPDYPDDGESYDDGDGSDRDVIELDSSSDSDPASPKKWTASIPPYLMPVRGSILRNKQRHPTDSPDRSSPKPTAGSPTDSPNRSVPKPKAGKLLLNLPTQLKMEVPDSFKAMAREVINKTLKDLTRMTPLPASAFPQLPSSQAHVSPGGSPSSLRNSSDYPRKPCFRRRPQTPYASPHGPELQIFSYRSLSSNIVVHQTQDKKTGMDQTVSSTEYVSVNETVEASGQPPYRGEPDDDVIELSDSD